MVNVDDHDRMQAVLDRLTRLEERAVSRASHVDDTIQRMEASISKLVETVERLSDDVKAAKTGLRVGLWISTTVVPAASGAIGWFAHHFAGK